MDFVHCNQCFLRNSKDEFLISSCFHIFCLNCAKLEYTKCPLCSKKIRIVKLDGEIGSNVKAYFVDPIKTFTETLTRFQRKIEFQEKTRSHLLKHLIKEKEKKRQMECYFKKKGQEFESQKKKLAEANAWIQTAEKKLQTFEEEKQQAHREMEELQERIKSLTASFPPQTPTKKPSTPFSFMLEESQDPGIATSIVNSTPNSSFNLVSPLVSSPALSLNSSNYHAFFESGATSQNGAEAFNDEMMFNTMSSAQSAAANNSDSSAFSVAFNNMFTPARSMNATNKSAINQTVMNMTSVSLDNWKAHKSNSFGTHDISKRDSSLPTANAIPSSSHLNQSHQNSFNGPTSQCQRSVIGMDRHQVRDMRRISSQPGFLPKRKSVNNRSTFMKPGD